MKRASRSLVVALSMVTVALLDTAVRAQPTGSGPWERLIGNWDMTFIEMNGRPVAKGYFAFHGPPGGYFETGAGGVLTETAIRDKNVFCRAGRVDGANVYLDCSPYFFYHLKLELSADGNTLRGTWSDIPDGAPRGKVTWTRARRPTIEQHEVLPDGEVALDYPKMEKAWAGGKRPRIRLRLRGRDLPIWYQTHTYPRREFAIDDPDYNIVRKAPSERLWTQGVLEITVELRQGARPGRKTLTVNGGTRAFDVVFTNYRTPIELRFVREVGNRFEPITNEVKYGEAFYVEARFTGPAPADRKITLEWPGGTPLHVQLKTTSDPKLLRAGPLLLQPLAAQPGASSR